jgi:hypothetical protein
MGKPLPLLTEKCFLFLVPTPTSTPVGMIATSTHAETTSGSHSDIALDQDEQVTVRANYPPNVVFSKANQGHKQSHSQLKSSWRLKPVLSATANGCSPPLLHAPQFLVLVAPTSSQFFTQSPALFYYRAFQALWSSLLKCLPTPTLAYTYVKRVPSLRIPAQLCISQDSGPDRP